MDLAGMHGIQCETVRHRAANEARSPASCIATASVRQPTAPDCVSSSHGRVVPEQRVGERNADFRHGDAGD